MTPTELDAVYTHLCKTMTEVGQGQSDLFLARLAMLAIDRLGDSHVAMQLIDAAANCLPEVKP
jgi:soluble P-type ATPase